jgi:hypothetical protein
VARGCGRDHVLIAAVVTAALLTPNQSTRHDPAVVTALVDLAAPSAPGRTDPVSTRLGEQEVVLRRYLVEGGTVVVATSAHAFPTPVGAQPRPGTAMAWTISRDAVTVYCPHSRVLLAGPIPVGTLVALGEQLHLG